MKKAGNCIWERGGGESPLLGGFSSNYFIKKLQRYDSVEAALSIIPNRLVWGQCKKRGGYTGGAF